MSVRAMLEWIGRVEGWLLAGAIGLIAVLSMANVVLRSLLGVSLAWAEELSQFSMLVVTFVGLSYAAGQGRHIRMTALFDQLPDGPRKALMVVITGTTSLLLGFLGVLALDYIETVYVLQTVSPALRWPLWAVYMVVPLGLFLGALRYALTTYRNVTSPGIWLSADVPEKDDAAPVQPGV